MRERLVWNRLAAILVVAACGGDVPGSGERDSRTASMPEFCRSALAAVDDFIGSAAASWAAGAGAEADRFGGTAVSAGLAEMGDGMNAFVSQDATTSEHQLYVNLMTLVRYGPAPELEVQPYLAESWELSEEGTELTFHLRGDVFWHDGTPTTAYDVAFTYDRMVDPETGFSNVTYWDLYAEGDEAYEVVDSLTITFRMERVVPEFLDAWRTSPVMPRHLLEDVPPAQLGQHPYGTVCPVGNGPFVFAEHRVGERWVFEANPTFPEELGGRPYVDRYVFRVIPEPTTRVAELLTGNVDLLPSLPPAQAARVEQAEGVELFRYVGRTYEYVGWNANRAPLSSPDVRDALTLALDRQGLVDALLEGYGRVAHSSVPPFHWAFDPTLEGLPYDPERARGLLERAGLVDRDGDGIRENAEGEPFRISLLTNAGNATRERVAQIMQAQLGEVGVAADVRVLEGNALTDAVFQGPPRDFDGLVLGWMTEFKLEDRDLFHSDVVEGAYAISATRDPGLDRLLDSLQVVVDRDEARALWRRYQEELIRVQPYTFLFFVDRLVGVRSALRGVTVDVRGDLVSIRDWWLEPEARGRRR